MIVDRIVSAVSSCSSVRRVFLSYQRRKHPWDVTFETLLSTTGKWNGYYNSRCSESRWQYHEQFHTYIHRNTLNDIQDSKENRNGGKHNFIATIRPFRGTLPSTLAFYHTSPHSDKAVAIILGLGTVSAAAYAASSAVKAWNEYKASTPEERIKSTVDDDNTTSSSTHQTADKTVEQETEKQEHQQQHQSAKTNETSGKRENIFKQWFGIDVGTKYYEGGFEDKMTRREAALILGVRETSTTQRIKEAHRKLLVLNHPDTGGSTYLSGKINEAKELLLKGRQS